MTLIDRARIFIGTKIMGDSLCEICRHPKSDHERVVHVIQRCKWQHCSCGGATPEAVKQIRNGLAVLDFIGQRM